MKELNDRGCFATSRERAHDLDEMRRREIRWREAALLLKSQIFLMHEREIEQMGKTHQAGTCEVCRLQRETRWCQLPTEPVA